MRVPFCDLAAQEAGIHKEVMEAVDRVLASGHYVLGENVEALEREIAKFCGAKYAVGLANGSDALVLALQVMEIGPGDEVITTPFTFIATSEAIHRVGAKPVFADIDNATFNLDPEKITGKITRRTRAILPVHLFGRPAPMKEILALARKRKLAVVEDAAQAIGATHGGQKVGALGNVGTLSFYPTKNLAAAGDGGMLLTSSAEIAEKVRMLRAHGSRTKYIHELHGMNSRLDELQAAILRIKLRRLKSANQRRRQMAALYRRGLAGLAPRLRVPEDSPGHIYHVFAIRVGRQIRDRLVQFLQQEGIGAVILYPQPLHLQRIYRPLGYRVGDFPVAEQVADELIALPIYAEMTAEQGNRVVAAVNKFFRSHESNPSRRPASRARAI